MPNIVIKAPKGVFVSAARETLAKAVHAAAKAVEGWGDDPRQEALTWVLIDEIAEGNFFVGGSDQSARVIPVIVLFYPPAGVIDADGRASAVRLVHEAVGAAKPTSDARSVMTSVMIWDVGNGAWGANGQICICRTLPRPRDTSTSNISSRPEPLPRSARSPPINVACSSCRRRRNWE